jgi:hypothetical protein
LAATNIGDDLRRGTTIGLALGVSGFIAGATIAGMIALSVRSTPPKHQLIIAEPAALDLGQIKAVPAAAFIDLESEPSRRALPHFPAVPRTNAFEEEAEALDEDVGEELTLDEAETASRPEVPLPRRKPSAELRLASTVAGLVANQDFPAARLPGVRRYGNWSKQAVAEARTKCESLLRGLDVKFETRDPIGRPKGCGIAYPLSVSAVAGVAITPPATLNCEMVAALHGWITEVVQPAAKTEFNTRLTGVRNASAYACRLRNNASSGKLSEHGLGNAFDIADFRFSNRMEASVGRGWSGSIKGLSLASRGDFMKKTRNGACKYFNTVLGPGSDAHHKDHYHLDLMRLRPGRGKYCR